MELNEIVEKLKELLYMNLKDQEDLEIGLDDNLILLGLNSITFIKIVVACENEFDIEFDDDMLDYEIFDSLRKLSECIKNKMEVEEN